MFKFKNKKKKYSFNFLKVSIISFIILAGLFVAYNYSRALIFRMVFSDSGLVGHWTMDQVDYVSSKMQDKTIYNHDATNYGATFTTDRFGNANSAMTFNGSASSVVFDNTNSSFDFTVGESFSYGAWFKMNSSPNSWHGIISKMPSWGNGYNLQVGPTQNIACGIGTYVKTSWAPEIGVWYHAMCVYDGSKMTLYVNGQEESSAYYSVKSGNSDLKLGMFYTSGSLPFYGDIDNVTIYNRALSNSEVKVLYSSVGETKTSLGTKRKSLILDMPLTSLYTKDDTTDSEVLTDKTPQSNDGQNVGASVGSEGTYFNGSTDYISVPNSPSLNKALVDTYNFTIATWFKPTSWVSYGAISKAVGGSWSHSTNSLWVYSSGIRCVMGDGDLSHSNLSGSYISTGAYQTTLNEWHHVVCKGDGTNLRLYIDGELKDTRAISGLTYTRKSNSNPLIIGKRTPTSSGGIAGTLKNLKIYDRPITDEEITKLYNEKVEKKTQVATLKGNLVLDLPLKSNYTKSETVGSEILTDRTPYSNDGQNNGVSIGSDSASFSGSLQNITIPAEDIVIDKGLTLSAWIKPTSYPSERATIIVNKYYLSLYNNGSINTYWYNTSSPGYHQTASGLVPLNEWTHVVTTWDGTQNKIYINGVLKKTTNTSGLGTTSSSTTIGAESISRQFLGEISNVLIYNNALSENEVESLYSKGRGY